MIRSLDRDSAGFVVLRATFVLAAVVLAASFRVEARSLGGAAGKPRIFSGGFYVTLGAQQTAIGGDFDGTRFLHGGGSLEIVPDAASGTGWNAGLGYTLRSGRNRFLDMELGYESSTHDGTWAGLSIPEKLDYKSINLDMRAGRGGRRALGFGILGLGFPTLTVPDGSTDGVSFADAKFSGISLRLGGGLVVPIVQRLSFLGQAVYRIESYGHVSGIASGDLGDEKIDAKGTEFSLSLRAVLSKPR